MGSWNNAVMAMISVSTLGFLISEGELKRIAWIRAMRKCLLRMNCIIRYEQPDLPSLLQRIDLRITPQERQLTAMLHACATRLQSIANPQLLLLFSHETSHLAAFGILRHEDKTAFENVIAELGRSRLQEQIQAIEQADERLRAREAELETEGKRRAQLIRSLGFACGAAMFLILV